MGPDPDVEVGLSFYFPDGIRFFTERERERVCVFDCLFVFLSCVVVFEGQKNSMYIAYIATR
jgi:hypothetical protein